MPKSKPTPSKSGNAAAAAADPSGTKEKNSDPKALSGSESSSSPLLGWVWFGVAVYLAGVIVKTAYKIRMGAIDEFGAVIHEFDPYFNFRATEVRES